MGRERPEAPELGTAVKVWLPGETPFAIVVERFDDGSWRGRIDNYLLPELSPDELKRLFGLIHIDVQDHGYRCGQEVKFRWRAVDRIWIPDRRQGAQDRRASAQRPATPFVRFLPVHLG